MSSCHVCKVVAFSGLHILIFSDINYIPFFQSSNPSTVSSNIFGLHMVIMYEAVKIDAVFTHNKHATMY